jgi:hypothetical protein
MLVGGLCQLVAAPQSAALEYCAPIGRSHALAKAMHTHAAANLRLIRSFRHLSFLVSKIMATGPFRPAGHYTVGLPIRSILNRQRFVRFLMLEQNDFCPHNAPKRYSLLSNHRAVDPQPSHPELDPVIIRFSSRFGPGIQGEPAARPAYARPLHSSRRRFHRFPVVCCRREAES